MAFKLRKRAPHTGAKHVLLKEYLGGWFPVMASWNGRLVYFDAFAGAGEYLDGKPGSPLIALDTLVNHTSWTTMSHRDFVFLLNESHKGCHDNLLRCVDTLKTEHHPWPKNIKIAFENNTFVDVTTELLDDLEAKSAKLAPTFAFIDPEGVKHTPMAVLERLSAMPNVEMLLYFAHEAVVRFHAAEEFEEHLDGLFGDDDYLEATELEGTERQNFLHDLYARKLHERCKYPYIQSFAMYNHGGHLIYYLFFCTRKLKGFDLMKKAMWKVAPEGDFRFRDRFAGREVLFNLPPDTDALKLAISAAFAGRTVDIQEVIDWVIANTPFHSSHVKVLTLKPMQKAGLLSSPNQRTPNTYPPGTKLTFPPITS